MDWEILSWLEEEGDRPIKFWPPNRDPRAAKGDPKATQTRPTHSNSPFRPALHGGTAPKVHRFCTRFARVRFCIPEAGVVKSEGIFWGFSIKLVCLFSVSFGFP